MFARILARIGIRPGERAIVARFFWLHFALIASYTLARAVRDAVFLSEMSARRLPYLYIAVAACTAIIAAGMGRFTNRPSLQRWLAQILVVSAVVLVGFAALLHFVRGAVPPIAFYLWTGAYGLIHVSLFWVLANEAIDPGEAKRFFGVIGAGGILGGLAGGALATGASWALRPVDLALVAAAILFAVAPLAGRLLESNSSRFIQIVRDDDEAERRPLLQHRYVRLLACLFLLAGMTSAVLDYRFKVALQTSAAAQPGVIARFLGTYYFALNMIALLLQVFVSGLLLRRFGASNVALMLPVGVAAGAAAGFVLPGSNLLVAGTRLFDAIMRVSLARTSYEFFYYPLPAAVRRRAKAWIDVFVDRAAEALAGIAILAFYALLRGTPVQRSTMALLLALAWLAISMVLRRAYGRQLATSLRSLVSDPERKSAAIPEAQLIAESHRLLASPFEKRAVFAFELLESIDPQGLDARLQELLEHRVPAVRARALARLSGAEPAGDDDALLRRAARDQSAAVRTEALRLYAGQSGQAVSKLRLLLDSTDAAERVAAIEHMVARPGMLGDSEVESFVIHGGSDERRAVAIGIARRPAHAVPIETLLQLLDDPDLEVRRRAIESCGVLRRREFIPALLPHLARPATAAVVRSALAAYGNRVTGTLADWMRDPAVPVAVRWRIPSVLAAIGTQEAADELMRMDGAGDPGAGYRVLKSMNQIRERHPNVSFDRALVRSRLGREVEACARVELHLRIWQAEPSTRARDLLVSSLEQRLDFAMNRIFRRLGLIYAQREMSVGYRAVAGTSRRTRAQAVEFFETTLLPEDRRVLQPVLEDDSARRAALAAAVFGVRVPDHAASLHDLVHGDDAWLQSCALYLVGADRRAEFAGIVDAAPAFAHPLPAETAAWSRRRLEVA
jgi:AAA family ATP:ADP antiporter